VIRLQQLQAMQASESILFLLAFSTAIPQKMAAKQYVIENPAPDKNP
jgi:hypothetical protein